jgi:hypothetical protein
MKKLRVLIATALASVFVFAPAMAVVAAEEVEIQENVCGGIEFDSDAIDGTGTCDVGDGDSATDTVGEIARTVVNIFTWVVGVISVIMIIIGGFKYITSGGESSNVSGAKSTIVYAIVGLIIVILAQVIVRFVIDRVDTA